MGLLNRLKPSKKLRAKVGGAVKTALKGGNVFKGTPLEKISASVGKAAGAAVKQYTGVDVKAALKDPLGAASQVSGIDPGPVGALLKQVGGRGGSPKQAAAALRAGSGAADAGQNPVETGGGGGIFSALGNFISKLFGG